MTQMFGKMTFIQILLKTSDFLTLKSDLLFKINAPFHVPNKN